MKKILGKKLLFVTAHPDDESYAAAGTIFRNHQAGGTSYVACATFGERGRSHIKTKITPRQLKMLRKKELIAVSKFLKVSGLLMAGLPDAELEKKSNQEAFFRKLFAFAVKHLPELIISFGKDGISGHIDHISAGIVAKRVAKELGVPFLTFVAGPELQKSMDILKQRRKHGKYLTKVKHRPHDIEIKINASHKLKALSFHQSQFDAEGPFAQFSPKAARQLLSKEYFSY